MGAGRQSGYARRQMKTNRSTLLAALAVSLAAFSTAGCAEKEQTAAVPVAAAPDVTVAHMA